TLLTILYLYFFFQAEDGIRDRNVTGVQTCALPIYTMTTNLVLQAISSDMVVIAATYSSDLTHIDRVELGLDNYPNEYKKLFDNRSEERRVGKECRYRETEHH